MVITTAGERDNLGDTGVDGRIILRWIFRKWDVGGVDWNKLSQGRDRWRSLLTCELLGSIKCGEFLD